MSSVQRFSGSRGPQLSPGFHTAHPSIARHRHCWLHAPGAAAKGRHSTEEKRGRSICFANVSSSTIVRYELATAVARKCLLFETRVSRKRQHIIITGVRQSSPAWDAGLRPGDELVGISDPNLDTVWEFDEMTSFRFVKDALRMRIPDTVTVLINKSPPPFDSVTDALPVAKEPVKSEQPPEVGDVKDQFLDAVLSSVENDDSDSDAPSGDSVAAQLERKYQRLQKQTTRSTERIQARKAALSNVKERNDAPFFLTILAVFVGPPLLILIWAFSSGYLDRLSGMY